jgi:hypothetical protein
VKRQQIALAVVVVAALMTGACQRAAPQELSAPTGADDLVLQLTDLTGVLPPGGVAATPPAYSLYGDGRLISAPQVQAQTAWPILVEHRVTPAQVRRLLRTAADAGLLDSDRPTPSPGVGPDAPTVTVTVASTTQRRTATVPKSDKSIARLRDELSGYADEPGNPYQPTRVAVIAFPSGPSADTRPWTLTSLDGQPLSGINTGAQCTVLSGTAVDAARQAAADATPGTAWENNSRPWSLSFRPLLPDEKDCSAFQA